MTTFRFPSKRKQFFCSALLTIFVCSSAFAAAQFSTLYHFGKGNHDGVFPQGGLIADSAGNLYGTASEGGTFQVGTLFELSPPVSSGPWTETILHEFSPGNGAIPAAGLVLDSAGNLYGTTTYGYTSESGIVFQLSPPAVPGGKWKYTVLYDFVDGTNNGYWPLSGLILDAAGNLYGTTYYGGKCDNGYVFELSPPATQGEAWTQTALHIFDFSCNGETSPDGANPYGPLVLAGGALYGTTYAGGGATNSGVIFKLSPPAAGQTTWNEQLLYTFTGGSDGGHSSAGLTLYQGSLYGTTQYGGNLELCSHALPGCGVVFELSPPVSGGSAWAESVLYTFLDGSDGSLPSSPVTFDPSGNLYTTTSVGGIGDCRYEYFSGCGAVLKLSPPSTQGGAWLETTLHDFTGSVSGDQGADLSGLVLGRSQKLYGTTGVNNEGGFGTIFSIAP